MFLRFVFVDDDLITIIDDEDFAHAREYSKTGVVKMVIYSKNQVYVCVYVYNYVYMCISVSCTLPGVHLGGRGGHSSPLI